MPRSAPQPTAVEEAGLAGGVSGMDAPYPSVATTANSGATAATAGGLSTSGRSGTGSGSHASSKVPVSTCCTYGYKGVNANIK